jgi:hypothetical protein
MAISLSTYALCGTELLAVELNTTTSDAGWSSDRANASINAATARIEAYCNREFKSRERTEYHDGDGTPQIVARQYPIVSISALIVNSDVPRVWTNAVDATTANDRLIDTDTGIITLYNTFGAVPEGRRSAVKLTYTAGYATIPDDLAGTCAKLAAILYKEVANRSQGTTGTSTPGGGSASYVTGSIPEVLLPVLDKYRRWSAS